MRVSGAAAAGGPRRSSAGRSAPARPRPQAPPPGPASRPRLQASPIGHLRCYPDSTFLVSFFRPSVHSTHLFPALGKMENGWQWLRDGGKTLTAEPMLGQQDQQGLDARGRSRLQLVQLLGFKRLLVSSGSQSSVVSAATVCCCSSSGPQRRVLSETQRKRKLLVTLLFSFHFKSGPENKFDLHEMETREVHHSEDVQWIPLSLVSSQMSTKASVLRPAS